MTPLASVLIVDDEPAARELMARWVTSLGLRPHTAADADAALATLRERHYDLAVIDVRMPGHDGLWLAAQVNRDHPHTAVVLATAYTEGLDGNTSRRSIADLLIKPFQRDRLALAIDRGRQWRKQALEEVRWHAQLSEELRERCHEISARVRQHSDPTTEPVLLSALVAERTPDVTAHSQRVARYAVTFARALEVDAETDRLLEPAAIYHDLGKAAMPDALLTKPSAFTPSELAIMRRHVDVGADILEATRTLAELAPIVRATHEWFGGAGYPRRLSGHAIPLASRIIAIVDAYDAMTQDRQYRTRIDGTEAVAELLRCRGVQFDPDIITAFLEVVARH